ncbi:MAG: hypothetical protein DI589_21895 [Shinella sp.]|nr:MAG: hypothetical protein DI589_21895 [Shinella sp.]
MNMEALEARLRGVAALLMGNDILPPEGRFVDVTAFLAKKGLEPQAAAPSFPSKFTLPTRVYVAANAGACSGLLIAASVQMNDMSESETLSYLSFLPDKGGVRIADLTGRLNFASAMRVIGTKC